MIVYYNNLLINFFSEMPKFAEPITNVTAPVGREATIVCIVDDLGSYKVKCKLYYLVINNYIYLVEKCKCYFTKKCVVINIYICVNLNSRV